MKKKRLQANELLHLDLLSQGHTMKYISEALDQTWGKHGGTRTRLLAKIGAKNAAEAVRIGFENGWLKPRK